MIRRFSSSNKGHQTDYWWIEYKYQSYIVDLILTIKNKSITIRYLKQRDESIKIRYKRRRLNDHTGLKSTYQHLPRH